MENAQKHKKHKRDCPSIPKRLYGMGVNFAFQLSDKTLKSSSSTVQFLRWNFNA